MKVVGITGGIGSGKSTLRKWFASQGIPCFDSDAVGKELLNTSLKDQLIEKLGAAFYKEDGTLDRGQLAQLVFNNQNALEKLNTIVHPAVSYAFEQFKLKNKGAPFVIKEAAILFESGAFKSCDAIILVCAPKEQRIQRVMERDHSTKEAIQARMKHQWSDAKKVELSDYVIQNEYLEAAIEQAKQILSMLKSEF